MGNQRVIYDSEEDDNGLSPINSPARANNDDDDLRAADDEPQRTGNGKPLGDSGSTDPDFFKKLYEEQQNPAPEWVLDAMQSPDRQKSFHPKATDNSSSITDPTLKSAKKKALGKYKPKDLANLTQVTTPSAPVAKQRDVYDFSVSDEDEEGAPTEAPDTRLKTTRPTIKRRMGKSNPSDGPAAISTPDLSTNSHALDEEDESPRPLRKKRKSAAQETHSRHVQDEVDLLTMPSTAEMSQPKNESHVAYDGSDGVQRASDQNPPASFFIDPPHTLTSTQKQEYLRVSGCSELDREEHPAPPDALTSSQNREDLRAIGYDEPNQERHSPPTNIFMVGPKQVSMQAMDAFEHGGGEYDQQDTLPAPETHAVLPTSGSLSTIAYPTPSRYKSSIPPLPILDGLESRSSDVANSSSRRPHSDKTHLPHSSPDELSAQLPQEKKRGKRHMSEVEEEDELAQHDDWNSDKIGYSRETYVPRPSRRRSGADLESATDTHGIDAGNGTTRNKRRRNSDHDETAREDTSDSDAVGLPRERYAPRPSRRRSRAVVEDDEDIQLPGQSMPDTCPPCDVNEEPLDDADSVPIVSEEQLPPQATDGFGSMDGVDPDVWAALPEEIRQELRCQLTSNTSQASRTRRSGRAGEGSSSLRPVQEETPQPKKRGRKKKEKNTEELLVVEEVPAVEEVPVVAFEKPELEARPTPAPTATSKKKRGRPKKTVDAPPPPLSEPKNTTPLRETPETMPEATEEPSAVDGQVDEPSEDVVKSPKPTKAPAKRGRKNRVMEEPPSSDDDDEKEDDRDEGMSKAPLAGEVEDRQALRDISNMAGNGSAAGQEDTAEMLGTGKAGKQQEVTPEPKAKEVPKSASTAGQQGKAPLRVGLSKKSRIPPLLKIIRK